MPFGVKNAPSEFQKWMEDNFAGTTFIMIYIDDLLVYSLDLNQHKEHLVKFYALAFKHGIALSKKKPDYGSTKIK